MKKIQIHELKHVIENDLPFSVEWLGKKSGYDTRDAHRHGYYEIFLFEIGGGKHIIDFKTHTIGNYSIHFILPGQVHQLMRDANTSGCVIIFSQDFYHLNARAQQSLNSFPFFQPNSYSPVMIQEKNDFEEVIHIAKALSSVFASDNTYKVPILQSYLQILLLHCSNSFEKIYPEINHPQPAGKRLVSFFKTLLEQEFTREHQVSFYADKLNVTPTYLNMACKKVLGSKASDLIKERLILEAKRMLLFSELTGKETAYELNFIDPSHFGRFFKNQTGVSPQHFIKKEKIIC